MRYYFNHEMTYAQILSKENINDEWNKLKLPPTSIEEFIEKILIRYPSLGKKALVIGCGMGRTANFLAQLGFEAICIDVSPSAIELAKRRFSNFEFKQYSPQFLVMDVTEMKIDESFDLIVDDHCLHCLVHPNDRQSYFQQVWKHLHPEGIFLLETMIFDQETKFAPSFLFDHENVLWVKTPQQSCHNQIYYQGQSYIPLRKVIKAHLLEQELLSNNFEIQYFFYCQHLKCEIPGNEVMPIQNWPSLMRVYGQKSSRVQKDEDKSS